MRRNGKKIQLRRLNEKNTREERTRITVMKESYKFLVYEKSKGEEEKRAEEAQTQEQLVNELKNEKNSPRRHYSTILFLFHSIQSPVQEAKPATWINTHTFAILVRLYMLLCRTLHLCRSLASLLLLNCGLFCLPKFCILRKDRNWIMPSWRDSRLNRENTDSEGFAGECS